MMMVYTNNLFLVVIVMLYIIKIVFSNVLDLDNVDNSSFYMIKIVERGVTKIMILSTPENKITEIRKVKRLIWMSDPGEYVKCVTIYEFYNTRKGIMTIEIKNPQKTKMFYLRKYYSHYVYTSKQKFEDELKELSKYTHQKHEKALERMQKFSIHRKRKFPSETDDTEEEPLDLSIKQKSKVDESHTEPLEPETIQVEISSDDEDDEPIDLSIEQKSTTTEPVVEHTEEEIIHLQISSDEEGKTTEPVVEHTEEEIIHLQISSDEEGKTTEPVVEHTEEEIIHLQISSDEEHIQTREPEHTEESKTTELETTKESEQLKPETIPVEIGSDDEPEVQEPLDLSQYYTKRTTSEAEHIEHAEPEHTKHIEPTEPETITVEIESDDDEHEEELTKQERKKHVMDKLKKMIKQRIKEKSKQYAEPENYPQPLGIEHEDHTHQDLIILGSEPSEESHTEDNNSSTIVRTESTKPQPDISTEDTHTQTDTDIDKKTRSSLPLKKRPYKQD
ncbi:Tash1-like protein, putative [Theileria annulata]|uniref:Tash1-like protein, putative n=1 Tax=Theileria annulata TaxID=5874 RepID=Q4UHE3_THEAN|nr:Tash1-like protein, putative [Theileria annulata]CAI73496.1 Tash1-like protein, putative [Theileria annulata]|eukprot:XP_954173.1 Tash1-like protein, putative [Theileria annulata]